MINKQILADKAKFFKVVNSCKTAEHFDCALILYNLFCRKWNEEHKYNINVVKYACEMLGYIKGHWEAKKTIIVKKNETSDLQVTDGHSVNDDDMHWIVSCPNCEREEYTGYFDSNDTNKCKCGTEFKTKRIYFDNDNYIG
jgi:hypothetical protein